MATEKITRPMKPIVVPIKPSGALGEYDISFAQYQFVVELSKVPWLGAYIDLVPRVNGRYTEDGYGCYYEPDQSVPYFFVAAQGILCGYFYCFEMLPVELSHYYKLCQALQVVSAKGLSSNPESLQELRDTIAFFDKPETSEDDKINRPRVGTAAFKFVYLMIMGDFHLDSEALEAKQEQALMFVKTILSNKDYIKWDIRMVVRAAYQVRFETTWDVFKMLDDFGGQPASKEEDFEAREAVKKEAAKKKAAQEKAAKEEAERKRTEKQRTEKQRASIQQYRN
ncbi:hypothetical protein BOTCAL_0140g00220 [Botryotinia calthae]|uniref:Uncharacterized protein n=1 Tax=Botryotinia calthae TaxID=38488 RepID=A0A4Y8D3L7_9HELO|nr:hypothetical protein BOTCAL_0140g00220 [Botryotinia calthae]